MTYQYLTTSGSRDIEAYTVSDSPGYRTGKLYKSHKWKAGWYADNWLCLDTETSTDCPERGWLYQWAIAYNLEDYVTIGRTAPELVAFLKHISDHAASKVVVYVHNLSYDLSYLERLLDKTFDDLDIFYVQSHHSLTARCGNLEFRCSYKLANNSLDGWSKALGTECRKAVGEIDYKTIRFPDQELTAEDWHYQISDIMVQRECIRLTMKGFDITTIPLTSTGLVRYDCRKAARSVHWFQKFQNYRMSADEYDMLTRCFSGGYTHGNRYHADETIEELVHCYDFTSSYPARIAYNDFPCKHFERWGELWRDQTVDEQLAEIRQLQDEGFALMMTLYLLEPRLRPEISMPYISASKCYELAAEPGHRAPLLDNGRVLRAERLAIPITDIDLDIILQQYTYQDLAIGDVWRARKSKLPDWFTGKNREYFRRKCQLPPDSLDYMKSKNKLNGIYGMTASRIVRNNVHMDVTTGEEWHDNNDPQETLTKYFNSRNNFMIFSWGVWVTAYARAALFALMNKIAEADPRGWDCILYCDTDSVFTTSTDSDLIERYNEEYRKLGKEYGATFTNIKGKEKTLGVADLDKVCKRFRYLHSKCYAYETPEGKLKVTIAGVSKRWRSDPGKTNADELGDIDNLREGFIFKECGGTGTKYNYHDGLVDISGHSVYIGNSAVIVDTEYRVSDLPEVGPDGLPLIYWEEERASDPMEII